MLSRLKKKCPSTTFADLAFPLLHKTKGVVSRKQVQKKRRRMFSSKKGKDNVAKAQADDARRAEFTKYVNEVSLHQRRQVAERVEKLCNHKKSQMRYFFGSLGISLSSVMVVFRLYGPRNMSKTPAYLARPVAPALAMGLTTYGIFFVCRLMMMQNRLYSLIEDYEYELKRVKAHHVEAGIDQLAWLQFVSDQVRQGAEGRLDMQKLKQ